MTLIKKYAKESSVEQIDVFLAKETAIQQMSFLLRDWKKNIQHFDIVEQDILMRIERDFEKYIPAAIKSITES